MFNIATHKEIVAGMRKRNRIAIIKHMTALDEVEKEIEEFVPIHVPRVKKQITAGWRNLSLSEIYQN